MSRDPTVLAIEEVLAQGDRFDAFIDVRAPTEYAEDHVPGALNTPVLDDAERARIGTLHKQVGAFEARRAGAALVARNIAHHLETIFADKPRDWRPLVYCWRGGQRSAAMAHVMQRVGWRAVQLVGGYKAYRRHVMGAFADLSPRLRFIALCGETGAGKSRLLAALREAGAQVLDLEQLAAHRGSVLGSLPDAPQPGQKWFESCLWEALARLDDGRPVFVESESQRIGALRVPDSLMLAIRAGRCVALDVPVVRRVALLLEEYAHYLVDTPSFESQLVHLTPLHGKASIERWLALARSGEWEALVEELLKRHYDPAYRRSIARNFTRYGDAAHYEVDPLAPGAYGALATELAARYA